MEKANQVYIGEAYLVPFQATTKKSFMKIKFEQHHF